MTDITKNQLELFEHVNGLCDYKRTEDLVYFYWGDFKRNNFRIRILRDELQDDTVDGNILLNLFGHLVERRFFHAGVQKAIGSIGTEKMNIGVSYSRVSDMLPPTEILKLAAVSKFQVEPTCLGIPDSWVTVRFGEADFDSKLKVYNTVDNANIIRRAFACSEELTSLCYANRKRG